MVTYERCQLNGNESVVVCGTVSGARVDAGAGRRGGGGGRAARDAVRGRRAPRPRARLVPKNRLAHLYMNTFFFLPVHIYFLLK